ncbi:MAG TPA: hypothetical protein VJ123_00890 [Anaerolineales bacterium]|nr:hypothetical protein [Anaerolineales bacterium]
MTDVNEGSVEGRGKSEMVPERGDPFAFEGDPRDLTAEELAALLPSGLERRQEPAHDAAQPQGALAPEFPAMGTEEDHGLGAVEAGAVEESPAREQPWRPAATERRAPIAAGRSSAPRYSTVGRSTLGSADAAVTGRSEVVGEFSEEMVQLLVSDERLRQVWDRADFLRSRVYDEINNLPLARQLLDRIERARNQLMAGRENFEEAERVLNEAEYRIHLAARVTEWSASIGKRLLVYELAWVLVIALGMLYLPRLAQDVAQSAFAAGESVLSDLSVILNTMLWGGLGGVVNALVGLRTHVARDQDFDRQWAMWYVTNPIMGIVLGAFVFLIVRGGLLAILPNSGGEIQSTWLVYAFGWIAGFQQNVAYDLVERVVKIFQGGGSTPAAPGG